MTSKDLEHELARGEALSLARLLGRDAPTAGDPVAFTATRVRIAAVVLAAWSTDSDIRDALRPVFEAAVPDQRALLALGDIDAWLRHGRLARSWWVQAAAGPDPDLAALGAWRAGRADLRGGRPDDALPLLRQADLAGITEASLALGRLLEKRGEPADADAAFRRARTGEDLLCLAEEHLRADDLDRAERELTGFCAGSELQRSWECAIRGEIAFWRGDLEVAESRLGAAMSAPGSWPRRARLRLAQIAIAQADPVMAHH
ncbi:hypothetical protein PHK61_26860 [Actinomycetospora lutea]|uniref:hypothetical protein n=1 Tax=Actinomycetospora lutea TaxID=663604 RepID=UPI0023658115|nr:hypothetical protein [Actinomycetospora lutea]MDD7942042.1 hypothetical protein [Actinomycetospora lutea]